MPNHFRARFAYLFAPAVLKPTTVDRRRPRRPDRFTAGMSLAAVALCIAISAIYVTPASASVERVSLQYSHIPFALGAYSPVGETDLTKPIVLDIVLEPRHPVEMQEMLTRITDPRSSQYGRYLTPDEFKADFGRTDSQVQAVVNFASANKFAVTNVASNNLLVQIRGTVADVDAAFGISLRDYRDAVDGRIFHAPNQEPTIDASIAPYVHGIVGLSNLAVAHMPYHVVSPSSTGLDSDISPDVISGLTPQATSSIYQMTNVLSAGVDGKGQVLGLFELGTYKPSDITTWDTQFGIKAMTINAVSVDGYSTASPPNTGAAGEFELDIDMLKTWAPGASQMRVYENNPSITSVASFTTEATDIFTKMATDTVRPNVISVSYDQPEDQLSSAELTSEAEALQQLALQGQTVCVASGDTGAFADQSLFSSDTPTTYDPASQPFITSVGGTDLYLWIDSNKLPHLLGQTSWYDASDTSKGPSGSGGGGGVSGFWALPSYQFDSFSTDINFQGSTTNRNVPDVSIFGDYDSSYTQSYAVYITADGGSGWEEVNGTSAASPLWAAFLADVNQERAANTLPNIGFANPAIYADAESFNYRNDFYDVDDGSTNGYYAAWSGYDNSTGWGSILAGVNLLPDLALEPIYLEWGLSLSATTTTSATNVTGKIAISEPASKAEVFKLSSNSASAKVPATATIAKGAKTVKFTVTVGTVSAKTSATITAVFNGFGESEVLTINP